MMETFNINENSVYLKLESKLNMIIKIIEKYDFLNDTEKIILIKNILNDKIKGV